MHLLHTESGLLHRRDCGIVPTPLSSVWVEVPEDVARMLKRRLAPAWMPTWMHGSLGTCAVCHPEQ